LKSVLQLYLERSSVRYLLGPAVLLVTISLLWIGERADFGSNLWLVVLGLCLLPAGLWMMAAVLDRGSLIWRLLMIWITEAIPVALLAKELIHPDPVDSGLATASLMFPVLVIGILGLIATFAAWVYRPGEGGLRYPPL